MYRWLLVLGTLLTLPRAAAAQTPPTGLPPEAAVAHHDSVQLARRLYAAGDHANAAPLLARLVERTPEMGELWFRLGRSRAALGDEAGAAAAFRRMLSAGYRYGAYVPYQLARLAAFTGDEAGALRWLEAALATRYEDRPDVVEDSAFAALRDDPRFLALAGVPATPAPSRDAMWRADLDYLLEEARRMHAAPDTPARTAAFADSVSALKARVADLSNDRMVLETGRLMALLGDGHTGLYGPPPDSPLAFVGGTLPLAFYAFADGVYVVNASDEHRAWVGARVERFGPLDTDSLLRALPTYMHHDNVMTPLWLGVHHILPWLAFLQAVGATDTLAEATLTLRPPGGEAVRHTFQGGPYASAFPRKLVPPAAPAETPLYLRRVAEEYWLTPLPDHDAVYVQFNQVRDAAQGPDLAAFADTLQATLARTGARVLVVDVRHNNGGNNGLLWPLLRTLVWWERDDPAHTLYVLTGRGTFSAAQNFLNRAERMTEAVFVGEPSSSRPNFTGEETNLTLPRTRLRGSISTLHWQDSDPDDVRPFIVPDVPVRVTGADYLAGRDPVLEAVWRLADRRR